MKDDINLTLARTSEKKQINSLMLIALGIFGVVFVIGVALILYSFSLSAKSASLDSEETDIRGKIAASATKKQELLTIGERLSSVRKIMSTRQKIDQNVDTILTSIPESLSVNGINADDSTVVIKIASSDLSSFNTLLEQKIPSLTKNNTSGIKTINVNSFTEDGSSYILTLAFNFKNPIIK